MLARCPVCDYAFGEPDEFKPHIGLQHIILNHPHADILQEYLDGEVVKAACTECSAWFDAPVSLDVENNILTRRAACDACIEAEPMKELLCVPTTAKAVLEGRETDANKPEGWTKPTDSGIEPEEPDSVAPDEENPADAVWHDSQDGGSS